MGNKTFFDNARSEAKTALSKVVNKIEEVSRISAIKFKISSLKSQINDLKKRIGDHVYINRKDYENSDVLKALIRKIQELEKEIKFKQEQIADLKEK